MLKVHKISIVINLSVTHILSLPAIFPKINNGYTKEGGFYAPGFLINTPALRAVRLPARGGEYL